MTALDNMAVVYFIDQKNDIGGWHDLRRERISSIVRAIIGEYETRDPIQLAREMNMEVVEKELPDGIAGFVAEVFDVNYIFLHHDLPEPDKHYIIAHEIFHYLDEHPDYTFLRNKSLKGSCEIESDLFAASLLIYEEPEYGETIERYACRTSIPLKLVRLWFNRVA